MSKYRFFFWFVFSCIRTEYGDLLSASTGKYGPEKTPYLDVFHAVLRISFLLYSNAFRFCCRDSVATVCLSSEDILENLQNSQSNTYIKVFFNKIVGHQPLTLQKRDSGGGVSREF